MRFPWLASYPSGVPSALSTIPYQSLSDLLNEAFAKYGDRDVLRFKGSSFRFRHLDRTSRNLAAYLQSLGLNPGDRVALMMPNVPQYPVAAAAVLRAGMVVVNTNPLYTARELENQLNDSGAKAIVILENMAVTLSRCLAATSVEHVVVTTLGDMLPLVRRFVFDFAVKYVKKLVPDYEPLPHTKWRTALRLGKTKTFAAVDQHLDDVAVLQYTGGTTGVPKGAVLTHGNILANVLQSEAWNGPVLQRLAPGEQQITVCALPLYHVFAFTLNMMLNMRTGGCSVLIPNPRDIRSVVQELRRTRFHCFPAVNTLFAAIARHPDAAKVDWSSLLLSVGGGMAVQEATAKRWVELTGNTICQGYGLSETSPTLACNSVLSTHYSGTIGLPLPSTDMRIIGADDTERPVGEPGEIAVKGPQVMAGYWNRPEETRAAMTADGYFRTGDIGVMDERGCFRVVDRKKDMINVSGFNVYPNEIEDVVMQLAGVAEAAAVGVADEAAGEVVKLFVVRSDPALTAADVKRFCRVNLIGYKRPRRVEFREALPKTSVGKVMRRALREEE